MRFVFSAEATPDAEIVEVRRLATVYLRLGDTNHGVWCGHANQSEASMRRERIDRDDCDVAHGNRPGSAHLNQAIVLSTCLGNSAIR